MTLTAGNKGYRTARRMSAVIRTRSAHVSVVAFDGEPEDHKVVLGLYYPNGTQESAASDRHKANQGAVESEGLGLIDWVMAAAAVRGLLVALGRRIAARLATRAAARIARASARSSTASVPKAPKSAAPEAGAGARAEASAADDAASRASDDVVGAEPNAGTEGSPAAVAVPTREAAAPTVAGPDTATLLQNATQPFKATPLTQAGRALTKHPEVLGYTKQTLRTALRTDAEINAAAEAALADILSGARTNLTAARYGNMIQFTGPTGFGARFTEAGDFIGFTNPGSIIP